MHYSCGVVVPATATYDDCDKLVTEAMAKFREEWSDDEHTGFWDWWVIGGRYTGVWTPDYEPRKDPRNITDETCHWCKGNGIQDREVFGYKAGEECGNCLGSGKEPAWSLAPHEGDLRPVQYVLDLAAASERWILPYTIVIPDIAVIHREVWDGKDFVPSGTDEIKCEALQRVSTAQIVMTDYHS
jgi:hypothetical protein